MKTLRLLVAAMLLTASVAIAAGNNSGAGFGGGAGGSGGGGGSSPISVATVALTANQLNHLNSAPVTLVAAGGAGTMMVPIGNIIFASHPGSIGQFGPSGSDVYLGYLGSISNLSSKLLAYDNGVFTSTTGGSSVQIVPFVFTTFGSFPPASYSPITYADGANTAIVLWTSVDFVAYGAIASSSVTGGNAGASYAAGDTGRITSGGGDANYVVDTVNGGGAVLTYHLADVGTGYAVGTGKATATGGSQPGSGTGFQIDIATITPANGTGTVIVPYVKVTLP